MQSIHRRFSFTIAAAAVLLFGCNLPAANATPTISLSDAHAATVVALQTRSAGTATAQGYGEALSPSLTATLAPVQPGAPQTPVVTADTLCSIGPGPQFDVVSTIFKGTAVNLLGRSAIPGWFIVRNPTYGDPCWLQATALQLPSGFDVSALPLFNPPWTPTPTSLPTSALSATPTSGPGTPPAATPTSTP